MPVTARAAVITGPAKIVRDSKAVHTSGNVTVREVLERFPIPVDAYGTIDHRAVDARVTVSFTPDGRWTSDTRALLFPSTYLNPTIGSDIFTAADVPLTIHDSNSHLHTVIASALTKMPQLILRPNATLIGPVEFTGIRGTGADWNDADKLYTQAGTGGNLVDTAFAVGDIKTQMYTGVWTGIAGFTSAFPTVDGWTIDSELDIGFIQIDEVGTVKAVLRSVSFMAKCRPIGVTYANITAALKSQGTGGRRGRSLQLAAADLVITGEDASTIITLKNANLFEGGFIFGATDVRDGELAWITTRAFAAGVPGALLTLA